MIDIELELGTRSEAWIRRAVDVVTVARVTVEHDVPTVWVDDLAYMGLRDDYRAHVEIHARYAELHEQVHDALEDARYDIDVDEDRLRYVAREQTHELFRAERDEIMHADDELCDEILAVVRRVHGPTATWDVDG